MTLFESSMELSEAILDHPLPTLALFDDAIQKAMADIYKNHQEKEQMVKKMLWNRHAKWPLGMELIDVIL